MAKADATPEERSRSTTFDQVRPNDHDLIAIAEWIPGKPPTDYEIEIFDGQEYELRFWRCRNCGQERNRRDEFAESCTIDRPPCPVFDGGYSIEDPRTRRALSEDMTVRYGELGPTYEVASESGRTYEIDVEAETCSCPDHTNRAVFCKHLRRVDLAIRAGVAPGPDGTFVR